MDTPLSEDIPPPCFSTNINELRSFSTALSAFINHYDELNTHITFINSSIHHSILPNHNSIFSDETEKFDLCKIAEGIDVMNKPEQTENCKMPEGFVMLKKPEEVDTLMNPEENEGKAEEGKVEEAEVGDIEVEEDKVKVQVDEVEVEVEVEVEAEENEVEVAENKVAEVEKIELEAIDASKNPKEINTSKNRKEITAAKDPTIKVCTSKKREGTGIRKKIEKTNVSKKHDKTEETANKSIVSVFEILCQDMNAKELKKHVTKHYSELKEFNTKIANALKRAKDPAKLVLDSIGRFFVQGSRSCKGSRHNKDNDEARLASVLVLECFVMISGDGIKIAKQEKERAAKAAVDWKDRMIKEGGLRRTDEVDARGLLLLISGFGIEDRVFKIRDIVDLIRASDLKRISAALRCSVFLVPKIPEVIDFMAKNDLEVKAADIAYTFGLEDKCHPRNILVTYLHKKVKDVKNASSFKMLEGLKQQLFDVNSVKQCLESHNVDISKLLPEFKINEIIQNLEKEITKVTKKKKFSGNRIVPESKRARFSHENMPRQQKPVDHYVMDSYNRSILPTTNYNRTSYTTNHPPSSVLYNAPAMPDHIPYVRPWVCGPPEPLLFVPSSGHLHEWRGPSPNLYPFAAIVEKESGAFHPYR